MPIKSESQHQSNSTNFNHKALEDTLPEKALSSILFPEIEFREEWLIDYYFEVCFVPQFKPKFLPGSELLSEELIRILINSNITLCHAVCASAALARSGNRVPLQKEILEYMDMALVSLRKAIMEQNFDESLLLAIIELANFEVHDIPTFSDFSAFLESTQTGEFILMLLCWY